MLVCSLRGLPNRATGTAHVHSGKRRHECRNLCSGPRNNTRRTAVHAFIDFIKKKVPGKPGGHSSGRHRVLRPNSHCRYRSRRMGWPAEELEASSRQHFLVRKHLCKTGCRQNHLLLVRYTPCVPTGRAPLLGTLARMRCPHAPERYLRWRIGSANQVVSMAGRV